jgi:hypothetical protein
MRIPQQTQQVENTAMPSARFSGGANADMFGAAEARQIGQFANVADKIAGVAINKMEEANKQKVIAKSRDSYNSAAAEYRAGMSAIYSKKGKDAVNAGKEAAELGDTIGKKYTEGLDDTEKNAFTAMFDNDRNLHMNKAFAHQDNQVAEWNKASNVALQTGLMEDAQQYFNDPKVVGEKEGIFRATVEKEASDNGMDEPQAKQLMEKRVDEFHTGIMNRIAQDSTVAALKYMDENKDKFDTQTYVEKRATVEKSAKGELALTKAMELSKSGLTIEDQLAEVDMIKDPAVAAATRKLVVDRNEENTKIQKAKDEQYIDSEVNKLIQNPQNYKLPPFAPEKLATFVATHRKKLIDEVTGKNGAPGMEKVQTDWKLYHDLGMSIKNGDNVDLTQYRDSFENADFKSLMSMKLAMQKPEGQKKAEALFSRHEVVAKALSSLPEGQFDPKKGPENATRYNRLTTQLQFALAKIPDEKFTPEVVDNVMKDLTSNVIIGTNWYGGKKTVRKFEIGYASEAEREVARKEQAKEKLPAILKNLPVSEQANGKGWYRDQGNFRIFYDADGNFQGSMLKLKEGQKAEVKSIAGGKTAVITQE